MQKRARAESSTALSDCYDNVCLAKRRAPLIPPRRLPLSPVNTDFDAPGLILPLTSDNLGQHTLSTASTATQDSTSDCSSYSPRLQWDSRVKLQAFGINVDTGRDLPEDLKSHVNNVLKSKRVGPRSPNARLTKEHRLAVTYDNKTTAIRILEPLLLFAGKDNSNVRNGVARVSSKLDFNLSQDFLPPPPPNTNMDPLTTPQADTCIGYMSTMQAISLSMRAAFASDEEAALVDFTLNPELLFPFLSSQWTSATGEAPVIAHLRSARDGTAIVRYLEQFYNIAYDRPATTLECAHISFTCDCQMLNIWLHWRELDHTGVATYYMQSIYDCTLRHEAALLEARELLWNHVDYALDGRLRSLKEALPSFRIHFAKRNSKNFRTPTSSRASARSNFSTINNSALDSVSPTPSSRPDKLGSTKRPIKRPHIDGNVEG
ncbi:uncharacterized protein J4E92_010358 [Alternaria infectoria]|uniref:uncharacterized protein n=1 Tax=Alternaria infectoria TaxID=45303 RepID=UPI00221FABC9|nr:uncharacterized protein J4E92_010358 [Alternaria infectoria]KAI4910599.1 hypothetical protein J4E92_010358 [Alternaria infectoria]